MIFVSRKASQYSRYYHSALCSSVHAMLLDFVTIIIYSKCSHINLSYVHFFYSTLQNIFTLSFAVVAAPLLQSNHISVFIQVWCVIELEDKQTIVDMGITFFLTSNRPSRSMIDGELALLLLYIQLQWNLLAKDTVGQLPLVKVLS